MLKPEILRPIAVGPSKLSQISSTFCITLANPSTAVVSNYSNLASRGFGDGF